MSAPDAPEAEQAAGAGDAPAVRRSRRAPADSRRSRIPRPPTTIAELLRKLLDNSTLPLFVAGVSHADTRIAARVMELLCGGGSFDPNRLLDLFQNPDAPKARLVEILSRHKQALNPQALFRLLDAVDKEHRTLILRLVEEAATDAMIPELIAAHRQRGLADPPLPRPDAPPVQHRCGAGRPDGAARRTAQDGAAGRPGGPRRDADPGGHRGRLRPAARSGPHGSGEGDRDHRPDQRSSLGAPPARHPAGRVRVRPPGGGGGVESGRQYQRHQGPPGGAPRPRLVGPGSGRRRPGNHRRPQGGRGGVVARQGQGRVHSPLRRRDPHHDPGEDGRRGDLHQSGGRPRTTATGGSGSEPSTPWPAWATCGRCRRWCG